MTVYLISDLHLCHANIVDYCDRRFSSVEEMNESLINNWNSVVSEEDTVLFGGDLALASKEEVLELVRNELNGSLVLVTGNHDELSETDQFPVVKTFYFTRTLDSTNYEFFYTHWPPDAQNAPHYSTPPRWFNGWVIHGHVHNSDLDAYPFINHSSKTINVSAELLDYTPISLGSLLRVLRSADSMNRGYETIRDY